jgi:hypothetical protein
VSCRPGSGGLYEASGNGGAQAGSAGLGGSSTGLAGSSASGGSGGGVPSAGGSDPGGSAQGGGDPAPSPDGGPDDGFGRGTACPALADGLITDFTLEAGDDPAAFRFGDDSRLEGTLFVYPTEPNAYALSAEVDDDEWRLRGSVGDYSGFGLALSCNGLDASAYSGIAFRLRGDVGAAPDAPLLRLIVWTAANEVSSVWLNERRDPGDAEVRSNFGRCRPAAARYDGSCAAAAAPIAFDGDGLDVFVRWDEFSGGSPEAAVDPREITSILWQLVSPTNVASEDVEPYDIDLRIDDLRFAEP